MKITENIQRKNPSVLICCGGGIDSTALINFYLKKGFQVQGIHFDYGQPSCKAEKKAVEAVSAHYEIEIDFVKLRPKIISEVSGELLGRNALFILSALSWSKWAKGIISLGIHANTPYYDCTPDFCKHLQVLLDGYSNGIVRLDAPFLLFSKEQVFSYCRQNQIPIELTYSCETNSEKPCGICGSCVERQLYDSNYSTVQT